MSVANQRPLANCQENPLQIVEFPEMFEFFHEMCELQSQWEICTEFATKMLQFRRFFCLSEGETALHYACKSFLTEDAVTLFRF